MLGGIFKTLGQIGPITFEAIQGLKYSINFISQMMQETQIADFIYQSLLDLGQQAIQTSNIQILTCIVDILEELCK
jgi:uncharacterized protein (UPF0303 family)